MGPFGLHMYAQSFLTAARSLSLPTVPFEPARPYLVCHAIELGLKAFLSLQGAAMIELADGAYGHNLEAILQKAEESDLKAVVRTNENFQALSCLGRHVTQQYGVGRIGTATNPSSQLMQLR